MREKLEKEIKKVLEKEMKVESRNKRIKGQK